MAKRIIDKTSTTKLEYWRVKYGEVSYNEFLDRIGMEKVANELFKSRDSARKRGVKNYKDAPTFKKIHSWDDFDRALNIYRMEYKKERPKISVRKPVENNIDKVVKHLSQYIPANVLEKPTKKQIEEMSKKGIKYTEDNYRGQIKDFLRYYRKMEKAGLVKSGDIPELETYFSDLKYNINKIVRETERLKAINETLKDKDKDKDIYITVGENKLLRADVETFLETGKIHNKRLKEDLIKTIMDKIFYSSVKEYGEDYVREVLEKKSEEELRDIFKKAYVKSTDKELKGLGYYAFDEKPETLEELEEELDFYGAAEFAKMVNVALREKDKLKNKFDIYYSNYLVALRKLYDSGDYRLNEIVEIMKMMLRNDKYKHLLYTDKGLQIGQWYNKAEKEEERERLYNEFMKVLDKMNREYSEKERLLSEFESLI